MSHYFVNNAALPNGNHEVHSLGCASMPSNKAYLGNFESPDEAMIEARKDFWQPSVCAHCRGRRTDATTTNTRLSVSGIYSLLEKVT